MLQVESHRLWLTTTQAFGSRRGIKEFEYYKEYLMSEKEKPWTIDSWEELRLALAEMKPRSKLYTIIKDEITRRKHWKQLSRKQRKLTDE
jgi:hypothetical protein